MTAWILGGIGLVAIVGGVVVFASSRTAPTNAIDPAANVPGAPRDDGATIARGALDLANTIARGALDAARRPEEQPKGTEI